MFKRLKRPVGWLASWLDRASRGRLSPNAVTWLGLVLHLPVGWLIVSGHWTYAGLALLIAASLDALDGALARLQGSASDFGAWLDASTDRLKETIVFGSLAYSLAANQEPLPAALAAGALGVSVAISYVKAKGEALLASKPAGKKDAATLAGGFLSYEGRVLILVLALISRQLPAGLAIIIIGGLLTIIQRGLRFRKSLGAG